MTLAVEYARISETGPVRESNEDCIVAGDPPDLAVRERMGWLFAVADGVGGHRAGEVASSQATRRLLDSYYAASKKPSTALKTAFQVTNLHICDLGMTTPEYRRMETTLSALALVGNQAHIGHVGDSRIYRVRAGQAEQLTLDHSEVGELVRMQILTPAEAQHHPRRHVVTRTIGSELLTVADFRTEKLAPGDRFVLCTDGLWEPITPEDLAAEVIGGSAAEACRRLVALALERGSRDNVSVLVVNVLAISPWIGIGGGIFWEHARGRLAGARR